MGVVNVRVNTPAAPRPITHATLTPEDGRAVPLVKNTVTIGRSSRNDIKIVRGTVSRVHATIVRTPIGYKILDNGSKNGVTVNDEPVKEHYLQDGDKIGVAEVCLRFSNPNADEAAATQEARAIPTPAKKSSVVVRAARGPGVLVCAAILPAAFAVLVVSLALSLTRRNGADEAKIAFQEALRQSNDAQRETIESLTEEVRRLRKQVEELRAEKSGPSPSEELKRKFSD